MDQEFTLLFGEQASLSFFFRMPEALEEAYLIYIDGTLLSRFATSTVQTAEPRVDIAIDGVLA